MQRPKLDIFFYPGAMQAVQETDPARNSPVTMRSSYAEANSGGAFLAATKRQESYYEAVRPRSARDNNAGQLNNVNSASTANLVDVTLPKEFYPAPPHCNCPPIVEEDVPRMVDKNSKILSRGPYFILIAICLISVSLTIFCCVTTLNMQQKIESLEKEFGQRAPSSSAQVSSPSTEMCVFCDDLKQGPFPEDNQALLTLDQRTENGTEICCANKPEQVSTLFDLFTKRKLTAKCNEESRENCSSTSETRPSPPPKPQNTISAHLQIGRKTLGETGFQPIRNWLYERSGTHLDGMALQKGRLIVPETGVYFVYSQAGFLIYYDPGNPISAGDQSVFHYIYRYNARLPNSGRQELMRSDIAQCWEQNKSYARYTSYIGAAIRLEKNDEVYVNVSNYESLVGEQSVTFFGMFKVR